MTSAGLDLKNPGGKEMLVVGGAALGLGLIYFALSKKKAPGTVSAVPASGHGLGAVSPPPFSGGMRSAGGPFTGNAFTDANAGGVTSPIPSVPAPVGPRPGPPTRGTVFPGAAEAFRLPVQHAVQGAQEILGSGSPTALNAGAPNLPAPPGGGGTVSGGAAAVYHALIRAGLQPFQAAGIMGNIANESSFNTQAVGDQGTSFGLIQWHNTTYPNAAAYVTGNVQKDFQNQINGIVQLFRQQNIGGTTAAQVGGNWASQIEGCVGCQPGGSQYSARVSNAQAIYQQIAAGAFNPPAPKMKPVANVKPATAAQIRNLFPIVKPRPAARRPARRPGRRASSWQRQINSAVAAIARAFQFRPPPSHPAYRPTPRRGPGHPLLH